MDILVGCDVGGTFTDFAISIPSERRMILHKVPSTSRAPEQAIINGLREVFGLHGLTAATVTRFAHGTTVGTNALIERQCGKVAVVTTEGFRDLLEIGRQTRPNVYHIHRDHPEPLVERALRFEVAERRLPDGTVVRPLDDARLLEIAEALRQEAVDCVVVCFLHSYAFPEHEERAAALLRCALPDAVQVISSAAVYPEFREYERFSTAVLNGALINVMEAYLARLSRNVAGLEVRALPKVSQSSGGLMSIDEARRLPVKASLSGPAAGVIAAARHAAHAGFPAVITLDMGGTSADVSLMREGVPAEVSERLLAGFRIRLPALDVNSVGAGGGSIAWIDRDGLLKVGPRSAGAQPGPACYDRGGTEATVTDANVVLGRLNPFALLDGRMPIREDLAAATVDRLAAGLGMSRLETARGILSIACAKMVKAIRQVSVERGLDPSEFALFAFGGAGPLHAAEVARQLDMPTILVPLNPGILCAEGALNSVLTSDFVASALCELGDEAVPRVAARRARVEAGAADWFALEGLPPDRQRIVWSADLRYFGQNYEITLPFPYSALDTVELAALRANFHREHATLYGFANPRERIQLVNIRAKTMGLVDHPPIPLLPERSPGAPVDKRGVYFGPGPALETPVYRRGDLAAGQTVAGPVIIDQFDATTVVFPGDICRVDPAGNLIIALFGGHVP